MTSRLRLAAGLFAAACCAQAQQSDEPPTANPSRPTLTSPATLPPVGYLQFEQGFLGSHHSLESNAQNGVNQVTKLAVHPRLMLEVSSQPFAASTLPDEPGTSFGSGDVLVGGQAVLYTPPDPTEDEAAADAHRHRHRHSYVRSAVPTVSCSYMERVHTGTTADIDLGSQDRTATFLFSGHSPHLDAHYDINIVVSQQSGDVLTSGSSTATHRIRRGQFGQTFSLDRPVYFDPKLQFSLEVYHFSQPLVTNTSNQHVSTHAHMVDMLFGPSYELRPNLVFDAALVRGFTATSTRWQTIAGVTYLLPKRVVGGSR